MAAAVLGVLGVLAVLEGRRCIYFCKEGKKELVCGLSSVDQLFSDGEMKGSWWLGGDVIVLGNLPSDSMQ